MQKQNIRQMVQLAILTAIILVLAFTPLGYLRLSPTLSVTFLSIPVVIGAIMLGPAAGAFLGCVFGLTSFAQCFGMDPFGTALMSINVFYTFVMCVVTRTLMGFLSAWVYRLFSRIFRLIKPLKNDLAPVSCAIACASAPLFNTIFFMGTLFLFFRDAQVVLDAFPNAATSTLMVFVFASIGLQAVCELIASLVIGTAICTALLKIGFIRENRSAKQ